MYNNNIHFIRIPTAVEQRPFVSHVNLNPTPTITINVYIKKKEHPYKLCISIEYVRIPRGVLKFDRLNTDTSRISKTSRRDLDK